MSEQSRLKPLAIALGTTFATALSLGNVTAAENPFGQSELSSGYMVAEGEAAKPAMEGKCGEGKCGGAKTTTEGKCGEGKCGGAKATTEGKSAEGKCGGDKTMTEGKCGEGKCGAGMKK